MRGVIRLADAPPAPRRVNLSADPALERLLPEGLTVQEAVVDADRGLRWAFVRLIGLASEPAPSEPARLETRRGVLSPHVVGLAPGQPLEWTNRDPLAHTIHAGAAKPGAGFLRPSLERDQRVFEGEGLGFRLRCDVHPWEVAYACVVPHSRWAITSFGGMYEIRGVPPGRYVLEVWHEACEPMRVDVEVHPRAAELRRDVELRLQRR